MKIVKVNEEVAFSDGLTAEERAALPKRGYRMLAQAGMPEEIQDLERFEAEEAGLRYAEIPVNPHAWSEERFLLLEQLLFPKEARPAVISSPRGRRAGVMALVWDAIQKTLTVEQAEVRARQFGLNLPDAAKDYLRKNSPAYDIPPKLRLVEGLPFPLDDETLPGGFHRPT